MYFGRSAPTPSQSESSELQPELALVPLRPVASTNGSVFSNSVVLERVLLRFSDILVTEVLSTEWTGASRNQCLLWAAMTSKAFRDPALNILWANLADGSLFYLLKTLSSFTLIQGKYVRQYTAFSIRPADDTNSDISRENPRRRLGSF